MYNAKTSLFIANNGVFEAYYWGLFSAPLTYNLWATVLITAIIITISILVIEWLHSDKYVVNIKYFLC